MKVKFNTFDKVNEFVKITTALESDIFVKSGRYVVDGKSIMGLYSLDLSKTLELEMIEKAEGESEKLISKLVNLNVIVD